MGLEFRNWLSSLAKTLRFASWGALGGFVAALLVSFNILKVNLFPKPEKPPRQKVDVLFVLDVTGSMKEEIDGVRDGINDFVAQFASRDLDAQIGLIAFRDRFIDEEPQILQFEGKVFTKDPNAFATEVGKLEAQGGGDDPESVLDALVLAARQPFRPNAEKILVFIGDAPPHIPDKETQTVADAVKELVNHKIDQLALTVQQGDLSKFEPFRKAIPGNVFPLSDSAIGRANFSRALPEIAQRVAEGIRSPLDPNKVFQPSQRGSLLLAVSLWTATLSMGICLSLIIGQNRYLKRRLLNPVSGFAAAWGSFAAGAAAGAIGLMAAWTIQTVGDTTRLSQVLPPAIFERWIAWAVLGSLLGAGMASFVPNLKRVHAAIGGAIGGVGGAIGLTCSSGLFGDDIGRVIGATILGFFIGLMVGLVEAAFREFWLEIGYGRESRTVSLGREPVSIGSAQGSCTVYARNAPGIAYRYRLDQGAVICEDVQAERETIVLPGDRKVAGIATITVRSGQRASTQQAAKFLLRLSNSQSIALKVGVKLTSREIPGLEPQRADRVVAEVVRNPNDQTVMGLMNLSHRAWTSTTHAGEQKPVDPGRSVKLALGTKIHFGTVTGELAG